MPQTTRRTPSAFRGCLLGGAVGGITDDTQMTLFTAEGLLRAASRWELRGICHVASVVRLAYVRWLKTQGFAPHPNLTFEVDGWLSGIPALHARRSPGRTCVTALEGERFGTVEQPLNHSKGCGGVTRLAPVGLYANNPFRLGCELAALTHGHASGFLAAGCLARLVFGLVNGASLPESLEAARSELATHPGHDEVEGARSPPRRAALRVRRRWSGSAWDGSRRRRSPMHLRALLVPLLLFAPFGLAAQQRGEPVPADTASRPPARTSHGWPVLGRLTHLCSGSVLGTASEISWEVFTSPDPTDRLLATYRTQLATVNVERSRDEWTFRATDGERTTRVLAIRPTPPFVQTECPAAPRDARTFAMFSRMTPRP